MHGATSAGHGDAASTNSPAQVRGQGPVAISYESVTDVCIHQLAGAGLWAGSSRYQFRISNGCITDSLKGSPAQVRAVAISCESVTNP